MPDDYLTVDEVAARMALPLEMIQRRIESGDIPVHWVEIGGKLEMRISAAEIGVPGPGGAPTPFPTPEGFEPSENEAVPEADSGPASWSVRESQYPTDVWAAAEAEAPAPAAAPPAIPWEAETEEDVPAAELGAGTEPVWRPDPGTWEDEPLQPSLGGDRTGELSPFNPAGTDAYFPLEEPAAEFAAPPLPAASGPFSPAALSADEDEEAAPFGSDDDGADIGVGSSAIDLDAPLPSQGLGGPDFVDVPRPSALAAAQGPESALAINSIDARELVAGLFERWERALEQRIQAEQRLRFEAELERRLRQVRDLRQELENTRKSTAAQLAEREQEVMALRNRLREQGPEAPPKSRGLFRR